jgi:dUTP pyrophosphatase
MNTIKFIKLKHNAKVPFKATNKSAGYDLSAAIDEPIVIAPHTTVKIGTGLTIQPPEGYFGAVFARSGIATKEGLRPANCTGVCDEDYLGEYIVALHNDSDTVRIVEPGQRIAQLVFLPYYDGIFEEVQTLDSTERGADGFGSSGKQ